MWQMSSWPRRYRHWATPIVVIALLAGSLAPGIAKPVAADSSYVTISGHVYGPDGQTPLKNFYVHAKEGAYDFGAPTDQYGFYWVTVLPGSYGVDFYDNTSTYVDGCYDSGASGNFTADQNACSAVDATSDTTLPNIALPLAGGGTPVGGNVPVVPTAPTGDVTPPVSLTFSNVDSLGTTTLTTSSTPPAPLPVGYQVGGSPIYFDLETTATYTGPITVCFSYAGITPVPTNLLHYENGAWVDVTSSIDTTSQTICGITTSLSPFALVTKIAPVVLTITASSGTMTYGGTVPSFTPSYSGFINGDTASSLTTQPTCTTTATSASPVGIYPVTCSGAVSASYTFTYVAGTLTVNKAPLTVTAPSPSRAYGSANPALAPTYRGFVASDTAASLSTVPTCVTTATVSSRVGTYSISCSGAVDPNYAFVYVAGTLTVNKAVLTVTANNKTKTYGSANPALTYSITGFVAGDKSSVVSGAPTLSTTARPCSSVGSYPITVTAGNLHAANYSFTYVTGTLTITAKALTVTANNRTKTYGTTLTLGTTAFTTRGLVNGDTVTRETLPSTGAAARAAVGTYPIVPSAAVGTELSNYAITYVVGTLKVTRP